MAPFCIRLDSSKRFGVSPLGYRLCLRDGAGHGISGSLLLLLKGTPKIFDLLPQVVVGGVRAGLQVDLRDGFRMCIGLGGAYLRPKLIVYKRRLSTLLCVQVLCVVNAAL